jgi:DNA-binding CsgD family transcriptional regulator
MKEIYWNSKRDMLVVEDLTTGQITRMDQMPRAFFLSVDRKIHELYPDIYQELELIVGKDCCEYGRVYQFFACNFSIKDANPDLDDDGNFIFERVSCPMRHTCKYSICSPRASGKLSSREIQVIALFAKGFHEDEIGERLFISKSTVHNHITHIYEKLNFKHSNPDRLLVAYAIKQNIC